MYFYPLLSSVHLPVRYQDLLIKILILFLVLESFGGRQVKCPQSPFFSEENRGKVSYVLTVGSCQMYFA